MFGIIRENFDTTTAAGELVLYSVANLAQYERRQTSERIAANIQARSERGLYNGGPLAFGYQLIPEKRGYLKIDEFAAKTVRECFKTFLIEGTLAKAGKSLNERGFKLNKRLVGGGAKPRLGYFTNGNLHEILTRITYIGKKKIKKNGEEALVDAVWEPIIDEDIFYKVQRTLKKNRTIKTSANPKRYPYLLSTLTSCGVCGDRLTGKSAHGRNGKVAYYEHGWATKKQSCKVKKVFTCKNHMRFQAKLLEPAVWAEVLKLINDGSFAKRILVKANELYKNSSQTSKINKVTEKIKVLEKQLEALAEHLTKLPRGLDPKPIFGQMQKIEIEKKELEKHKDASTINEDYKKPVTLKDYESFLTNISKLLEKNSSPDLKRKVCERLIHKIELMPTGFKIHFYTGSEAFSGPNSLGVSSNAGPVLELINNRRKKLENTKKNGSNSLQNGGPNRDRTCDLDTASVALSQLSYGPLLIHFLPQKVPGSEFRS